MPQKSCEDESFILGHARIAGYKCVDFVFVLLSQQNSLMSEGNFSLFSFYLITKLFA